MGKAPSSGASTGSGISAMTKATTVSPPSTVKVDKGGRQGGGSVTPSREGSVKHAETELIAVLRKGFDGESLGLLGSSVHRSDLVTLITVPVVTLFILYYTSMYARRIINICTIIQYCVVL